MGVRIRQRGRKRILVVKLIGFVAGMKEVFHEFEHLVLTPLLLEQNAVFVVDLRRGHQRHRAVVGNRLHQIVGNSVEGEIEIKLISPLIIRPHLIIHVRRDIRIHSRPDEGDAPDVHDPLAQPVKILIGRGKSVVHRARLAVRTAAPRFCRAAHEHIFEIGRGAIILFEI